MIYGEKLFEGVKLFDILDGGLYLSVAAGADNALLPLCKSQTVRHDTKPKYGMQFFTLPSFLLAQGETIFRPEVNPMIVMHPGEYIKEVYLDDANFSNTELASCLRVSEATVSRILSSKSEVSPDMAMRLERVLGRSAESWLAMQVSYSLSQLRDKDYTLLRPLVGSSPSLHV